jgi:hypothetical protein
MAGNRANFGYSSHSNMFFSGHSHTSTHPENNDSMEDDLIADFEKVSVRDNVRAALTVTNNYFNAHCKTLNNNQKAIDVFRKNTLDEADLVAERVEEDLKHISHTAKNSFNAAQQLLIIRVVQSYMRCLELDIEKYKLILQSDGKTDREIADIKIHIRDFTLWKERVTSAPTYKENKSPQPNSHSDIDQIAFVQLALNYWRSCYSHINDYETLMGIAPQTAEKKLWELEQKALAYLQAAGRGIYADMNFTRMEEPSNIDPKSGQPLSIADAEMSQQQCRPRLGT